MMRTTSQTVIGALTVVLAATAVGCSSHRSQAGAGPSGSPSGSPSGPASTPLASAPPTSAGPASSISAIPASPLGGSPSVTSSPSVTAPAVPAPPASTGVPPRGAHAVTAVAGLACPDAGSPGRPASPSPKPLPPSLAIKAVVRCETVQRSYPGLGSWSVQLAEVADSGLGPFLADLRAPSDPMPSGIMCPDFRILVPWFELVDAAGAAINVAIPTDQCGAPKTAAITALQALHFRVTDAVRIGATN